MGNERPVPSVVRLFPGWADSPIWIPGGPVDLEESQLTSELVEDLTAWESRHYAVSAPDSTSSTSSPSSATFTGDAERSGAPETGPSPVEPHFLSAGKSLASRLATELGHSFAVSFESGVEEDYLARSDAPATNPAAARVLAHQFDEEAAVQERLRKAGVLHAYAPFSGKTFRPAPPDPGRF